LSGICTWSGICELRNGATVSNEALVEENTPAVNLERVAAWRLSPRDDWTVATEVVVGGVAWNEDSGELGDRG
jgi:hypothetical protein